MSMHSFSKEQMAALLEAARRDSYRNWLIIRTAYQHGLRVSEITKLTAEQVVDGFLSVQRLKRSLHTTQPCSQELSEFARGKSGRLFHVERRQMDNIIKKYCAQVGIPQHLAHMHACKHSIARHGLSNGVSINCIQAYLGHVSGNSTLQYLKVGSDEASRAFSATVGAL